MSDILGMLQEVDLLTDGVSLSSLNRAAALKLGDEFERPKKPLGGDPVVPDGTWWYLVVPGGTWWYILHYT